MHCEVCCEVRGRGNEGSNTEPPPLCAARLVAREMSTLHSVDEAADEKLAQLKTRGRTALP